MTRPTTTDIPEAVRFAARFWGGRGTQPRPAPRSYGPRDIDGGRPSYPAGWAFASDGFNYLIYQDGDVWQMVCGYDCFSTFWSLGRGEWAKRGWGPLETWAWNETDDTMERVA